MGQLVQHGYSLVWCGSSQNNTEYVLIVYTIRALNYVLSCMLLPQERWNFEEMQSGVMAVRPAWRNPIPVLLLHLSRGKVDCDFWSQLCTEARVPFNDVVNTTDFRTNIKQHSVQKFYLFILLHDWVRISISTAKFQVEAHCTTHCILLRKHVCVLDCKLYSIWHLHGSCLLFSGQFSLSLPQPLLPQGGHVLIMGYWRSLHGW